MPPPRPIYRGQGNKPFEIARPDGPIQHGQTVPYEVNGAPAGGDAATLGAHPGSYYLARANHTGTQLSTTISDLPEAVQDLVGAMVVNGANITLTYDDTAGTLTVAVSGTLPAARMPAYVGDVTSSAGSLTLTLATVNATPGSFGGAGKTLTATANAKGLVTVIAEQAIAITASQVTDFATAADARIAGAVGITVQAFIVAGTTAQYWRGDKTWQTLDKTAVGLTNVDNTSDANKPVSTAQQTALNLKADLASPTLTGTPLAPTAASATSNTQIATTAFVHGLITDLINASPSTLDTLKELADAIGDDPNFATTVATSIATKLAKASNLSDLTSVVTARANLGVAIGSDVQAWDADLDTLAGLTATTDNFIVSVGSAWASRTPAQVRATLGLVIGTNVQAFDADLTTWASITPGTGVGAALAINVGSAGAFLTFNGAGGTPSSLTLTNATGLPIAGLTASTATAIGVGSIELGHASDTTISRASAGDIAVEGNTVYRVGGTDAAVADGGTGSSTAAGARTNLGITAANVPSTATGDIAATNVDAAIAELEDEKEPARRAENIQAVDYTLVLADQRKTVIVAVGGKQMTIPPASSVAYPVGTVLKFMNIDFPANPAAVIKRGAGVSIYIAGGASADRSLAGFGVCWAHMRGADTWFVSGQGVT